MWRPVLAAADGMDHFDAVTFLQGRRLMLAARDDVHIELYRNAPAGQVQAGQQACDGLFGGHFIRFAIQSNLHGRERCGLQGQAF